MVRLMFGFLHYYDHICFVSHCVEYGSLKPDKFDGAKDMDTSVFLANKNNKELSHLLNPVEGVPVEDALPIPGGDIELNNKSGATDSVNPLYDEQEDD